MEELPRILWIMVYEFCNKISAEEVVENTTSDEILTMILLSINIFLRIRLESISEYFQISLVLVELN